jgi:hypothetical protein
MYIYIYKYVPKRGKSGNNFRTFITALLIAVISSIANDDDDDDVYLRLQYGKEFHNLVYMSYVKHEQNNSKHLCNNIIEYL